MIIRQENEKDFKAVYSLIDIAFKNVPYSDNTEHFLVNRLRKSEAYIPKLSLVAEIDNEIVGHIILTKIFVVNGEKRFPSLALAPVSVLPSYQGQGIGGKLIVEAHKRAKELGYESVILLGHSNYYPRFGYRKTNEFGIKLPFEVPEENCMAIELVDGALNNVCGVVEYSKPFYA